MRIMDTPKILLALFCLLLVLPAAIADVVLDEKTMGLTLTAAELSSLAYVVNPPSDGYDMLKSFNAGMYWIMRQGLAWFGTSPSLWFSISIDLSLTVGALVNTLFCLFYQNRIRLWWPRRRTIVSIVDRGSHLCTLAGIVQHVHLRQTQLCEI